MRLLNAFPQIVFVSLLARGTSGSKQSDRGVHPIETIGNHFIDSVTGEPFFIRGLAYQPGGSAEVNRDSDPLSDPELCARDIPLFQQLGVNTIRIYSLNPHLNHDKCMSMLAAAGIYLLLDVNSPMQTQHLNRYEPWTTYNEDYLSHIFQLVKQFSSYPNTLGVFAGNEVINDKKSSEKSPRYVKQVVGDLKKFVKSHCARNIPVGYSAADDLDYRVSLSKYLECTEGDDDYSVDFYGVNSYQWCGQQTMESSGYNVLADAYKDYTKPVLLSEFGCNRVKPRIFQEVEGLFSKEMLRTFSGGIAYEYSQESNDYGLVEIDVNSGDVALLGDFKQLQERFNRIDTLAIASEKPRAKSPISCSHKYQNLNIEVDVNSTLSSELIGKGVDIQQGQYVQLQESDLKSTRSVFDVDGRKWTGQSKIDVIRDLSLPGSSPMSPPRDEVKRGTGKQRNVGTVLERPALIIAGAALAGAAFLVL
ncbi:1,3-beta-glucanosyltransferase KNAG_0A01310 [Huiozyma naganishii CBS 8797]|uniref:1,3-beta-glucanosyltransferase n=1 Tax=Huiozyma naganishii (strain ATCC MYA-139 / BCRC 22969 / CBS 8797 / KCTC 17520 / NBRC 10181 / NCYC 3082 / Yp74L-3) TaxID=1071383 RepID=J7QZD1_HUIN7|nr:hypothetical protein KNAG_0A01310 [Kazachstania naganishii CBS 8797]CCK67820.1 hypothetical protein KNAG_0A01310 [Kazachstania naganishii CBS 8797]